ncbi:hypothetical protein J2Z40_004003, partial [Cytobacillus eiseniae]|nr:hypothetical protein [Cytobacillus eiseniae]
AHYEKYTHQPACKTAVIYLVVNLWNLYASLVVESEL